MANSLATKGRQKDSSLAKAGASNARPVLREIELNGPVRGDWPNYGKLGKDTYHCHLKKGQPTYVAVWVVKDKEIRLVEITYVGTHEKAPY